MVKRISILFLACALCAGAYADDQKKRPDLQIADNSFFDPTKKRVEEEAYHFGVVYRLEAGYVQHSQRTRKLSYPQLYLDGFRFGATFTFLLPMHFSLQTGLLYTFTYGKNEQHWRSMDIAETQTEMLQNKVYEHNLTVPARVYYTIPLWKQLNLFFFTGLQINVGISEDVHVTKSLSPTTEAWLIGQGIPVEDCNRMDRDRTRINAQWGLGGGIEWDRYRLQAGYDFGLNNLAKKNGASYRYMAEWGWFVSFSYRF
jgi:hypothetical protein